MLRCAFQIFFPACNPPFVLVRLLASLAILTLTVIQCYETRSAVLVMDLLTAGKLLGLLVIIVGGVTYVGLGNADNLDAFMVGSSSEVKLCRGYMRT